MELQSLLRPLLVKISITGTNIFVLRCVWSVNVTDSFSDTQIKTAGICYFVAPVSSYRLLRTFWNNENNSFVSDGN